MAKATSGAKKVSGKKAGTVKGGSAMAGVKR
jgi:hypothetical protein